ncbi:unnamed protein product [Closterium sp. Naga37s-1]|nr:unnamed protein product [Closterium sp. Naga37s-1]
MRARSSITVIIGGGESSSSSSASASASSSSRFGALMARPAIRRAVIVALVLLAGLIPTSFPLRLPHPPRFPQGCPSLDALADGALEEGELRASDFGGDFVFGFATSAAQVEGAVSEGGRGRSIWNDFAERAGKIKDASNPSVTADQFHRFKDDVALLKAMGATSCRFSISWSRIIPDGMGAVSEAGVQHYSRLIDELLANGIAPAVTLYHWDLPSHLHEAHGGWLNASIVHAFVRYADVCFSRFGDRVKTWITFNEPQQTAVQGYGYGTMAPGRCSNRSSCEQGDSSTEPYIVSHHIMLAHAAAVAVYRRRYSNQWVASWGNGEKGKKEKERNGGGGRIGMTMDCVFLLPADGTRESVDAAQRGMEFAFAWFADPLFRGDYPPSMRQAVGSRLPSFSATESSLLIGSSDFIGLNFYTAQFAAEKTVQDGGKVADVANGVAPWMDCHVDMTAVSPVTGKLIGERTASSWLHVVPTAIQHMLTWISHRYPSVPIIITENGMSEPNLPSRSLARTLCDDQRVRFYRSYLSSVLQARRYDPLTLLTWPLLSLYRSYLSSVLQARRYDPLTLLTWPLLSLYRSYLSSVLQARRYDG